MKEIPAIFPTTLLIGLKILFGIEWLSYIYLSLNPTFFIALASASHSMTGDEISVRFFIRKRPP